MYKIEIITNKVKTRIRTTDSKLEAVCMFWASRNSHLELAMCNHKHSFKISLLDDNRVIESYEYNGRDCKYDNKAI